MRHSSQSHHDHANQLEAERDQLLADTKEFLKGGVTRDLAHALAADQSDHSPTLKVQVPKESADELAASLRGIIADPLSVHVTDITGKQIATHPGITYEDLAEMVCNKGYRLHIVPPIDAAAFAADIASSTEGRVIIPGRKHIVHNDLAEYLAAALEEGDPDRMAGVAKLLRSCGDCLISKSGRAFADVAEGKEIPDDASHLTESSKLSELIVGWARFRTASTPQALEELAGPVAAGNRVVEISAHNEAHPPLFDPDHRMVEIAVEEPVIDQVNVSEDTEMVSDKEFQTYRIAKLHHARASMDAMREAASIRDHEAYDAACRALAEADPGSRISRSLSDSQEILLITDMAAQAREAMRRGEAGSDASGTSVVAPGTDLRDIIGR